MNAMNKIFSSALLAVFAPLSDADAENIVRRSLQYVALYDTLLNSIGWSLKNMLPSLMDEARLVLNMGVVREGERVLFQGMPWKVENIGLYSTLVNPSLSGGTTRITLGQLRTLNARPLDNTEAWFPTNQGDFVLLNDDRFGQVISQSPEAVQLRIPGRSICYLRTPYFLAGNPVNLSETGFGLYIHCNLDPPASLPGCYQYTRGTGETGVQRPGTRGVWRAFAEITGGVPRG